MAKYVEEKEEIVTGRCGHASTSWLLHESRPHQMGEIAGLACLGASHGRNPNEIPKVSCKVR